MTVTVTKSVSSSGGTSWVRLSGTIQEVLDELAKQSASALNTPYYYDDGSNAKALICRQE